MWTTLWDNGLPQLQWGVVLGASLAAAVTDLKSRRIPNILTGPVLLAGLVFAAAEGGLSGLGDSALACVALALPYILLFIFAGGGAGDAKLMGAVGAWLGVVNGLAALAAVSACAIVLAVAIALAKRRMTHLLTSLAIMIGAAVMWVMGHKGDIKHVVGQEQTKVTMPYGLAIFAGTVIAAAGVFIWRT